MTVENINVEKAIQRVNDLTTQEKNLSPALKASLEVLLLLVTFVLRHAGTMNENA